MNAERLHVIARALLHDLEVTEAATLMRQLAEALRQQVQNPAAANFQEEVGNVRQQLDERLAVAPSNGFSPAWRQTVDEMDIADLLGDALRERLNEIFQRNEITPSVAADEVAAIAERLETFQAGLADLNRGLDAFDVAAEELLAGEFEVGFLVPRDAVDDEFEELGKEFVELDKILGVFQELGTGTREDLKIRSIASSGYQVYLVAAPGFALVMSKVIESLLTSYQKILEIREAHGRLKERGVPDDATRGVLDHANERMSIDIKALTEELVQVFGNRLSDAGRANEIRLEITHSLNAVANRIDEGYSIEIRAGELPQTEEEDGAVSPPDSEATEEARIIAERQARMRFLNVTGTRILELPEGDEEGPQASAD